MKVECSATIRPERLVSHRALACLTPVEAFLLLWKLLTCWLRENVVPQSARISLPVDKQVLLLSVTQAGRQAAKHEGRSNTDGGIGLRAFFFLKVILIPTHLSLPYHSQTTSLSLYNCVHLSVQLNLSVQLYANFTCYLLYYVCVCVCVCSW